MAEISSMGGGGSMELFWNDPIPSQRKDQSHHNKFTVVSCRQAKSQEEKGI
jgi:hypothetical protein